MIRRSSLVALEIALALTAAAIIALGALCWRLASGPIPLPSLERYVEGELSSARDGRPVRLQDVELAWSPQRRGLEVRARNVLALDKSGRVLSRSDEVALGVSLSGTDRIGHGTGTQGPEMCEQLLRLDEALGVFLTGLKSVPGGAIVVLTADHGGSDFPERSAARGFPQAGRSDLTLLSRLNANLRTQFKLAYDPVVFDGNGLYVFGDKGEILPEKRRRQIADAAVTLLRKEPTVAAVHTLEELTGPDARQSAFPAWSNPEELTLAQRMTLSAVPGRSADIQIALNPGITLGPGRVGGTLSSHGSVWDYDRKVPIIFWWPGVTPQERFYPISTIDIAPTLANILGVWPPEDIDGRCMDLSDFGTPCPRKIVSP